MKYLVLLLRMLELPAGAEAEAGREGHGSRVGVSGWHPVRAEGGRGPDGEGPVKAGRAAQGWEFAAESGWWMGSPGGQALCAISTWRLRGMVVPEGVRTTTVVCWASCCAGLGLGVGPA